MIKVVALIISEKGVTQQKEEWRRYMNSNKLVKSFFIELDPNLSTEHSITNDTITIRGVESHRPGIYNKTIQSLKICLNSEEYASVDFFIRTNLSSFWIWDRLLAYIDSVPKTKYAASGHVMVKRDRDWNSPHGSNMILSRDVALLLLPHIDNSVKKEADDIAIGGILNMNSINVCSYPWFEILRTTDINNFDKTNTDTINSIPENVFTLRNNFSDPEWRRKYEVNSYRRLVDKFYH